MKAGILGLCAVFCVVCIAAFACGQTRWSNSNEDLAQDLDKAKDKVRELEGAVEKLKEAARDAQYAQTADSYDPSSLEEEVRQLRVQVTQLQRDTLELKVMLAARLGPPAPAAAAAADAPPGTPLGFHQDILAKADALKLTDKRISDAERRQAATAFDKWTVDGKVLGREVDWLLMLAEARDTRSSGRVEAVELRRDQLRQKLVLAGQELAGLRIKKVVRGFSASDKQKAIRAKEEEIKQLQRQDVDLREDLVDAKQYWITVTATPVGQPQVRISASVSGDDLNVIAGVPVGGTLRLRGYVGRIRREEDRFGNLTFPIDLVRCRAGEP